MHESINLVKQEVSFSALATTYKLAYLIGVDKDTDRLVLEILREFNDI
jgi:hypothetical protein